MIRLIDSSLEPKEIESQFTPKTSLGIAAQAFATEEGPGIPRRIEDRVLDLPIAHDTLDLPLALEQM